MSTNLPGFWSFFRFLHHFALVKLATSNTKAILPVPYTDYGKFRPHPEFGPLSLFCKILNVKSGQPFKFAPHINLLFYSIKIPISAAVLTSTCFSQLFILRLSPCTSVMKLTASEVLAVSMVCCSSSVRD